MNRHAFGTEGRLHWLGLCLLVGLASSSCTITTGEDSDTTDTTDTESGEETETSMRESSDESESDEAKQTDEHESDPEGESTEDEGVEETEETSTDTDPMETSTTDGDGSADAGAEDGTSEEDPGMTDAGDGGALMVQMFADDFEGDLSQWTGVDEGAHSGLIVEDPLNPDNQVLSLQELTSGGDIFSIEALRFEEGRLYRMEFSYLGLALPESVEGDFGGYAGLSEEFPGERVWFYATGTSGSAQDVLVDDGQWRDYAHEFTVPLSADFGGSGTVTTAHLMFEDYETSGGVAGDVFFDNVVIYDLGPVQQ